MSEANVEVVRRWFAALARGEVAPELWHPDLQIDNVPEFPITGPYHGHAGLRRWHEELVEVIEDPRIELDEAVALDEHRVLTMQRLVGSFRNTGIPLDGPWAAVAVVDDGKMRRISGYASRRQALEAAGRSK